MGVRNYVQGSENLTNYAYSSLFCRQLRYIKESAFLRKFPNVKIIKKIPCLIDVLFEVLMYIY